MLENDCRVWAWAECDTDNIDNVVIGTDIESYIDHSFSRANVTYFHNLAFDGSFIIDYLFNNGYEWVKEKPGAGQFTTLISNMGKFYSITVISEDGLKIEFRDSLKKIPLSVEATARAFNLPMEKLEMDYQVFRARGHVLTDEEKEYIRHDVQIVAQALKMQLEQGMSKLTVGADALSEFKSLTGSREFRKLFPQLSSDIDAEIRLAYRGGFTYANPKFAGKLQGSGKVYDVNSLYPAVMYYYPIPYGMPEYVEGAPVNDGRLYITSITFTARLKSDGIPCIQVKRSLHFSPTEYQTEIKEPVTISVTSVDLELWEENYEMDIISYNGSFMFQHITGVFIPYIDKWMEVKSNSTGGMRQIAKLFLNSLYGKFATNTNVTGKYPVLEDGVVKLKLGEHEEHDPVYTPAGVFITAHARSITIRSAKENLDVFAYADTDSLHLLTLDEPKGIRVHESDLGAWKCEGEFTEAVYVRAKQYAEKMADGTTSVHIAGLPKSIGKTINVSDLLTDQLYNGKLVPKRVPGGIVLTETTFKFTARGNHAN